MKQKHFIILCAVLIGGFIAFSYISNKINNEVSAITDKSIHNSPQRESLEISPPTEIVTGKITGYKKLEPNRQFVLFVFEQNGKEIARFKMKDEKIFDYEGKLFSGKVEYKDFTKNIKGTQEFEEGRRVGKMVEYYEDGSVQREVEYYDDKILSEKQYFNDGVVRMETDFTDASVYTSSKDVGVGRVNFRNGVMRYEWRFMASEYGGFNKSYNLNSELVEENYFDSFGQPITKDEYFENVGL